jgi:hypothetical protein
MLLTKYYLSMFIVGTHGPVNVSHKFKEERYNVERNWNWVICTVCCNCDGFFVRPYIERVVLKSNYDYFQLKQKYMIMHEVIQ